MYVDGIAVNVLSLPGLVPTPGVVHHNLDKMTPEEHHEPASYMAEASYALCTGDPATLTGRIAYSQTLLDGPERSGPFSTWVTVAMMLALSSVDSPKPRW